MSTGYSTSFLEKCLHGNLPRSYHWLSVFPSLSCKAPCIYTGYQTLTRFRTCKPFLPRLSPHSPDLSLEQKGFHLWWSSICLCTLLLSCVCGVISKRPPCPWPGKPCSLDFFWEFYAEVFDTLVMKKAPTEPWNPYWRSADREGKGVTLDSPF